MLIATFPKGTAMAPKAHTEFPSLEERIQRAGAGRSVEVGIMIGSFLATTWQYLSRPRVRLHIANRPVPR